MHVFQYKTFCKMIITYMYMYQARRPQAEIFRRGFVRYGRGFGGRSRLPEALGYLVQNPAIQQFPDTSKRGPYEPLEPPLATGVDRKLNTTVKNTLNADVYQSIRFIFVCLSVGLHSLENISPQSKIQLTGMSTKAFD